MNNLLLAIISAIGMGLGATLVFDLWGAFLQRFFKIPPSNICLVGRWIAWMPAGRFVHANIAASARKRGECALGWIAHYSIGVSFALLFVALAGSAWLEHPRLVPAVLFGLATVLAPFLILQPCFGLGVAASRAPNPALARLRSLMNHAAFGLGLYLFGWLAGELLGRLL
ncbi:MAG TPA: DUF2938 domain-containing protein [Anaerolinea sp.]|nr:DUF2938 domain-containing protein [Anaerolinea sp.]